VPSAFTHGEKPESHPLIIDSPRRRTPKVATKDTKNGLNQTRVKSTTSPLRFGSTTTKEPVKDIDHEFVKFLIREVGFEFGSRSRGRALAVRVEVITDRFDPSEGVFERHCFVIVHTISYVEQVKGKHQTRGDSPPRGTTEACPTGESREG